MEVMLMYSQWSNVDILGSMLKYEALSFSLFGQPLK